MKTIAQLALEYGVTTQSIYKRLKLLDKHYIHKDDKGHTLIDENGEKALFSHMESFAKDKVGNELPTHDEEDSQKIIDELVAQLQTKDEQIKSLHEILKQTNTIIQTKALNDIATKQKRRTLKDWFRSFKE